MSRTTEKHPTTQKAKLESLQKVAAKGNIDTLYLPARVDYKTMTDAELKVWLAQRARYWRTRARQIESQGVKGFVRRCEKLLAKVAAA